MLVRGLGPNSATVVSLRSRYYMGDSAGGAPVRELQTPEQADAAFNSFFGRGKVN